MAATLKANGIQGVRNTVRFLNPIVRHVQRQLRVDDYGLDVMQPNILRLILPDGSKEEAAFPQAIKDFLDAFNQGAHPDLELPADSNP